MKYVSEKKRVILNFSLTLNAALLIFFANVSAMILSP